MKIRMLKEDGKLKKGFVYTAKPYFADPSKLIIHNRVFKNGRISKTPYQRSVYRNEVEIMTYD